MTITAEPAADAIPNDPPRDVGRVPPHNDPAERSVLGAMLLSKDAIGDVTAHISGQDFYRNAHTLIYDAITALYSEGEPADAITVAARLLKRGHIAKVGGASYLHTLVAEVPTAASAGFYARIVAERAELRRLIEAGTKIVQIGYSAAGAGDEPGGATDHAQQIIYDLTDQRGRGDADTLGTLLPAALDDIEAAQKAAGGTRGIPTGFADLDRLLGGLLPGQLVVIAGRPGGGKSTAATDVARHAAIDLGLPTVIFALEMSKIELTLRILSAETRVPLHALRTGSLTDNDWTKLARRMGEISDAPLHIDDTAEMTLMEIRAKARRLKQQHNIQLIVVDYLGLMTPSAKATSREREVSELSRGLKVLGKELGVPVIAVHQLNRGPEQRNDKRPVLSDLRDSGAVEQDADIVWFVHRDDYYDKESSRSGEGDFIIAKHRNGPTDTVTVAAQLHLSRFVDMAVI